MPVRAEIEAYAGYVYIPQGYSCDSTRYRKAEDLIHLCFTSGAEHHSKMVHEHHDHAPEFGRSSLGTLDDDRPAPGGQAPFRMSTLVPEQFPAPPANVQLTRTSITGVTDDDDSTSEKHEQDMEKGQVRPAWTPVLLPVAH